MAKKIKKFSINPTGNRRGGEKIRRAGRQFDRIIIGYIALVIIAVLIGGNGDFSLAQPGYNGFVITFLLLPAYLPLMIADGICICFGTTIVPANGYEVYLLGGCDLLLALIAWTAIRWWAKYKQSANILKTAKVFVLIMFIWGIFQIICCGIQFAQIKSDLDTAVITNSTGTLKK